MHKRSSIRCCDRKVSVRLSLLGIVYCVETVLFMVEILSRFLGC